ncbi:MAG: hypothetical protein GF364_10250 [Candidatus Lokiarchaeota archaeon]|nr:hypothetical protein [Candidatus Lokiarchaeota archaeon]
MMNIKDRNKNVILTKVFLIVILIMPLTLFYSLYLNLYIRTPVPDVAWVSWYDDPQHEVYIGWETEDFEQCTVKYGTSRTELDEIETEGTANQFHIMNLTSLSSNTRYYYEIDYDGKIYTTGEFRTAPSIYSPFSFGLTADTQQKIGPGWHSHVAKIFDQKNYSFIAMVGDFVEDRYKAEWNDYFKRAGRWMDTIPLVPVQGNHDRAKDVDNDGEEEYFFGQYFPQSVDQVMNTNIYDTHQQFYFSFNWSSVHFQILYFPEVDIDDEEELHGINPRDYNQSFTPDHLAWIEEDLANAQDFPFRVSLFHCPITGAGFYGENFVLINELLPILHQYNVTVTVHGHAHHFERGILKNNIHLGNDLTYFVVGTGGGLADVGLCPVPETEVCTAGPSYTEAHATEDNLEFSTYTLSGELIDSYVIESEVK